MKKKLAPLFSILAAFIVAVSMAAPVAAQTPTPTPTPKMAVYVDTHIYKGTYVSGYIVCTTVEGESFTLTPNTATDAADFDTLDFTCLGEIVSVETSGYHGAFCGAGWTYDTENGTRIEITYDGTVYYDADVQTGGSFYPWMGFTGPGTVGAGEGTGVINTGGYAYICDDFPGTPANMTYYIYMHASVEEPCGSDWETLDVVGSGTIDATDEDGVPSVLVLNSMYRLTVFGGPWNDSVADRYDTAVKIGEGDWQPLDEYFDLVGWCSEGIRWRRAAPPYYSRLLISALPSA